MKQENLKQEIERVVTKVLPLVPKGKAVEKKDFEVVLNKILTCLHENTKIAIDAIAQSGVYSIETSMLARGGDRLTT